MLSWGRMPCDYIGITVLLVVVVPWRSACHVRRLAVPHISFRAWLALYGPTIAFQWLVAGFALWRSFANGLGEGQIGLTSGKGPQTAVATAALYGFLALNQWFSLKQLSAPGAADSLSAQLRRNLVLRTEAEKHMFITVALTASLC